jgi:hypothetical protein
MERNWKVVLTRESKPGLWLDSSTNDIGISIWKKGKKWEVTQTGQAGQLEVFYIAGTLEKALLYAENYRRNL